MKRGNFDTETDRHREKTMWRGREHHVEMRQRLEYACSSHATPETSSRPLEAGGRHGTGSSALPSAGTNPPNPLISDFQPPEPRDNTFLWLKPPSLWYFVTAATGNRLSAHSVSGMVLSTFIYELLIFTTVLWQREDYYWFFIERKTKAQRHKQTFQKSPS